MRSKLFFSNEDDSTLSGRWESEPGTSRWEFTTRGEIITVVSGSMTVHQDDADSVTLAATDTAYFPVGWKGTWIVRERLRKVFVVYIANNTTKGN